MTAENETVCLMKEFRIRLRPPVESDLPRLIEWDNDPEITRWAGKRFQGRREARKWYLCGDHLRRKTYAVELKNGLLIGEAEAFNISWRLRTAEIRVFIGDPGLWGRGLGEEVVRALVWNLFATTKLNQIFLRVDSENSRARRCYAKVGFKPRGKVCFGSGRNNPSCLILMTLERRDVEVSLSSA